MKYETAVNLKNIYQQCCQNSFIPANLNASDRKSIGNLSRAGYIKGNKNTRRVDRIYQVTNEGISYLKKQGMI